MEVTATPEAVALVRERGGRLYVWRTPRARCCSGMTFLKTAGKRPRGIEFKRYPFEPFELHLAHMAAPPAVLGLDARGKRVEAYWDGCAWVI